MGEAAVYEAFLSYSHADQRVARKLEFALESYRIPRDFRQGTKRFRVFRDVQDASLGELSDVLKQALDASQHLLVLCSPSSRASNYVGEEIEHFASTKGKNRIVPILVSGRPNSEVGPDDPTQDQAFHEALCRLFDEPLAADFRRIPGEGWWTCRERLREAKFQVIAKLLDTEKSEELVGRERRKTAITRCTVTMVALLLIGALGYWYYDRIPKPGIAVSRIAKDQQWSERAKRNLKTLRVAMQAEVSDRRSRDVLVVATWNLRDFARGRYGGRSSEALAYIAQIISHFDLVALQELSGRKEDFEQQFSTLMKLLGGHWESIVSGVSPGAAGNRERLAYVYDSRKITYGGFSDEIVLPEGIVDHRGQTVQIARTPFLAGFFFHNVRLTFCNVHIYYGGMDQDRLERRRAELDAVVTYLATDLEDNALWSDTVILLGDLQVEHASDPTLQLLRDQGFIVPEDLSEMGSNYRNPRPYDQITVAHRVGSPQVSIGRGGVFDYYRFVYRDEDESIYAQTMPTSYTKNTGSSSNTPEQRRGRYLMWKAFQMSDHLPKWLMIREKN